MPALLQKGPEGGDSREQPGAVHAVPALGRAAPGLDGNSAPVRRAASGTALNTSLLSKKENRIYQDKLFLGLKIIIYGSSMCACILIEGFFSTWVIFFSFAYLVIIS